MFTGVIIRLNVNTLRIRIDVSTFIVIRIWHQMHTKPHGNNDKILTLSGRCLPPSRMESCGGESEAVSHLNHWSSSNKLHLWCPNKMEFDKSHVQLVGSPRMRPKIMACGTSFTKTWFPVLKHKSLTRLWSCHLTLTLFCMEDSLKLKTRNSHEKSRQMLTKGHVLFVCFAFLI